LSEHNLEKQAGDIKKLEETLSSLQMKHIQTVEKQGEHIKKLEEALNNLHEQRRKLFNEVQEAKGNIRVFCRCRPLSSDEMSAGCKTVVDFDAAKEGCLRILHNSKIFRFDRVYTPKDDQGMHRV
jgi:kinesin family member C2/C3